MNRRETYLTVVLQQNKYSRKEEHNFHMDQIYEAMRLYETSTSKWNSIILHVVDFFDDIPYAKRTSVVGFPKCTGVPPVKTSIFFKDAKLNLDIEIPLSQTSAVSILRTKPTYDESSVDAILELRENYKNQLKATTDKQETFSLKAKIVALGETLDALGYVEPDTDDFTAILANALKTEE